MKNVSQSKIFLEPSKNIKPRLPTILNIFLLEHIFKNFLLKHIFSHFKKFIAKSNFLLARYPTDVLTDQG